jgi:prepilin-type N-terminal cleavage/methylation domain-containing protein
VTSRGFTLLETMIALVILGLVVVGLLQLFGLAVRSSRSVEAWTRGVAYAEYGMELAKLDPDAAVGRGFERLPNGFARQVTTRAWSDALRVATVTVAFPDGGRFVLERLVESP